MSATELIRQVAALPPHERALFERLFRTMDDGGNTPGQTDGVKWPDFGQRLHDMYGDKVAPDSQKIIEAGRGER